MQNLSSTIGFLAASLTTISFVPQVRKVWRTRSAKDVSLGMYFLFTLGVAMWLVYGILIHAWPVIVANAITLVLAGAVLVMRIKLG
jgi:MtN3 and saliva related transmembrane protein